MLPNSNTDAFTTRLGLQQAPRKRNSPAAPAKRDGPIWASVTVLQDHATSPSVQCYGAIKTSARGTIGHAVADKRVYCHEALHLKGKLQAAGYKQAVEKWDSDSDSDESDDEDLAL